MLTIALVREVPEALKPRKIEIGTQVPTVVPTLVEQKAVEQKAA